MTGLECPKLAPEQQLNIEAFLAFTIARPEGERSDSYHSTLLGSTEV
jgi:hypothetical protein